MGLDNAGKTQVLDFLQSGKVRLPRSGNYASLFIVGCVIVPPRRSRPLHAAWRRARLGPFCLTTYRTYAIPLFVCSYADTNLKLWDIRGDSACHSTWSDYVEENHVVIFVVDAADRYVR